MKLTFFFPRVKGRKRVPLEGLLSSELDAIVHDSTRDPDLRLDAWKLLQRRLAS